MTTELLAALTWDPQIRGFLIVLTAFIILPGSVYMLLATNTGAKVGFLLAMTGLTGWTAAMAWIWVVYGIGIKGDPPTWKVTDVVAGSVAAGSTNEETASFPRGWERLEAGNAILADATAAADKVLVPEEAGAEEEAAEGAEVKTERTFEPPFEKNDDYLIEAGYRKGGESYFLPGGLLERSEPPLKGWLHKPHYVVVQARPVIKEPEIAGKPGKPAADPTARPTNVVMVRDLGSLRFPSAMLAIAMSLVFAVLVNALHRRDKEIMATRAAPAAAAG